MQQELGTGGWRVICVLGLKVTLGTRVAKVFQFILPDGSTLLSADLNAV